MSIRQQMANLFFKDEVKRQVRAMLAAEDDSFTLGAHALGASERDRYTYDREQVLEQALDAWRVNPLARRIVGLTSQYVVGVGGSWTSAPVSHSTSRKKPKRLLPQPSGDKLRSHNPPFRHCAPDGLRSNILSQ
jgi:hypothetical protein